MENESFKKFLLRKIEGQNGVEYAIYDPTSGELFLQSPDIAMKELTIDDHLHYFTITNDLLDEIINNEGFIEVKGKYADNTFTPNLVAQRIIIKWNKP